MVADLLHGHGRFRSEYVNAEGPFLRQLASAKQKPAALYVGCSDSRVVPELLTTSTPGSLFVVRNVANIVAPYEHGHASAGAALEYAVGVLHVPHVIVCGHDGCGGIEALVTGQDLGALPTLARWLRHAEPGVERIAAVVDAAAKRRAAVEENVIEQLANVATFPLVRDALVSDSIQLHGWVYDLETAELRVYDVASDAFQPAGALLAATPSR